MAVRQRGKRPPTFTTSRMPTSGPATYSTSSPRSTGAARLTVSPLATCSWCTASSRVGVMAALSSTHEPSIANRAVGR